MSETELTEAEQEAAAHDQLRLAMVGAAAPDAGLEDAGECLARLIAEARAVEAAMQRLAGANDFAGAARCGVVLILAAETAEECAKRLGDRVASVRVGLGAIERAARLALSKAMRATGVGEVRTPHHTAHAHEIRPRVEIEDASLLPRRFWREAEPTPDRVAIGAALRQGEVPGARLVGDGLTVRISTRKDATR